MNATYIVTKPSSNMTELPMPNVKPLSPTSEMPSSSVRDSFPPTDQPLESYQVNSANILVLTILGITDDAKEHRQVYCKQNGG